uniref:50S ribosomal protein L20 n=1 Tax=Vicia sepium TaxID=347188 RepID=A0A385CAJ7_9FABA|nr:ribosomal protein L20 [Vicia sepium]AXQ37230.1 ribosomal protein L20 [Vicia sepium]
MNRVKRGSTAIKQSTEGSSSGSRGAHSNRIRTSFQQRIKALVSSQRDRDKKKRDFRSLWISRINARISQNTEKIYYNYSNLMYNLYKNQLLINRKIVAQISILKDNCLFMIANAIIQK